MIRKLIFSLQSLFVLLVVAMTAADNAPEQISLNYGASPSEMVAMWAVVGSSSSEGATCEFGTSPDKLVKDSRLIKNKIT
jgi:hypothetical protein